MNDTKMCLALAPRTFIVDIDIEVRTKILPTQYFHYFFKGVCPLLFLKESFLIRNPFIKLPLLPDGRQPVYNLERSLARGDVWWCFTLRNIPSCLDRETWSVPSTRVGETSGVALYNIPIFPFPTERKYLPEGMECCRGVLIKKRHTLGSTMSLL